MAPMPIAPGPRRFAVVVVVVAVLFCLFVIQGAQFFLVPTNSMAPTLLPGDRVVTVRAWSLVRGDLVVVPDPDNGGYLVKRVAGIGGDTLEARDGALLVNGEYAPEPYMPEPMNYAIPEIMVPDGTVFLLGDNRNHSDDSVNRGRVWAAGDVVGRAAWRYHPWARFGPLPRYHLRPFREIWPDGARPESDAVESPPVQDAPAP